MAFASPTVADFKSRFDRDFPFCTDDQTDLKRVRDVDVTRAFEQAGLNSNPALFETQAQYTEAMLLLSAHYLVTNLLSAAQGVRGAGTWLIASKSAGNMSESYTIPPRIARSPFMAALSKTSYGFTYVNMIVPLMRGNVAAFKRDASPY